MLRQVGVLLRIEAEQPASLTQGQQLLAENKGLTLRYHAELPLPVESARRGGHCSGQADRLPRRSREQEQGGSVFIDLGSVKRRTKRQRPRPTRRGNHLGAVQGLEGHLKSKQNLVGQDPHGSIRAQHHVRLISARMTSSRPRLRCRSWVK